MLEARIEELTAAVIALTKAIGGMQAPAGLTGKSAIQQVEEEVKAEAPNAGTKSPPTTDTSQTSSGESAPVNYDDVKRATNAVSAKHGVEKTKAALSRFGVTSAKALTEAQWPEYVTYMAKVTAGELDPEASHE
jgi:hypothetical protein